MSIRVAVEHRSSYTFDRPVRLAPHTVRLRPAPHCRTPILAYSLRVTPEDRFLSWQQDPAGNHVARLVFPEPVPRRREGIIDFLVDLNRRVLGSVAYSLRMEPGVQPPDETLRLGIGSCRDSAWLLVQILRRLGVAARFASGYLVQLVPDGQEGTDFTDLHAWTEAYVPGAGWVGLDPTSGLLAGEGHIPLACASRTAAAAPISGTVEAGAQGHFTYANTVRRLREDPRVTAPYDEETWERIDALGAAVDAALHAGDVRLTMGGEPTFVAADASDEPEWSVAADGPCKRGLAARLTAELVDAFAPGALLMHGQGKWYPGEPLPRWLIGVHWRRDGVPMWEDPALLGDPVITGDATMQDAAALTWALTAALGLPEDSAVAAHEDPIATLWDEARRPGADPPANAPPEEGDPAGWAIPLRATASGWETGAWRLRRGRLYLIPGDSPIGMRLPLDALTWAPEPDPEPLITALCIQERDGHVRAADSPFLRRPDLLRSLVTFWQHHPSLSYLFSGRFVGPTSQAPRVDEGRDDSLYELEIAFAELDRLEAERAPRLPWQVDRSLRNLLVDLTGNTHRAEFCIDKLFSPDTERGRLGVVELRAFEMPPHPRMALVQALLVRALVARCWQEPYRAPLVRWGTDLHDRFMLPWWIGADVADVARDLREHGFAFDGAWLDPFLEFRFPRMGVAHVDGVTIELRQAIEPWHVLGEEPGARRRPVRGLLGRAAADPRRRPDVLPPRRHLQQPPRAAAAHADAGHLRGRHPVPRLAAAVGVASDDWCSLSARVRRGRSLELEGARRVHVPRRPSRRPGVRDPAGRTRARPRPVARAASRPTGTPPGSWSSEPPAAPASIRGPWTSGARDADARRQRGARGPRRRGAAAPPRRGVAAARPGGRRLPRRQCPARRAPAVAAGPRAGRPRLARVDGDRGRDDRARGAARPRPRRPLRPARTAAPRVSSRPRSCSGTRASCTRATASGCPASTSCSPTPPTSAAARTAAWSCSPTAPRRRRAPATRWRTGSCASACSRASTATPACTASRRSSAGCARRCRRRHRPASMTRASSSSAPGRTTRPPSSTPSSRRRSATRSSRAPT